MLNTERIYNGLVRLPFYPTIKNVEIKKVVNQVLKFDRVKQTYKIFFQNIYIGNEIELL